jgi:hypothetical protein
MSSWWRVHECVLETDGVHAFGSVAIMRPVWRATVSLVGSVWFAYQLSLARIREPGSYGTG